MKVVIQRVLKASVTIEDDKVASIENGLLVLLGIVSEDTQEDIHWLVNKIVNGEMLVVSQFTLHASTKKGNRPSYTKAAKPEIAIPLYEAFISTAETILNKTVQTGQFGADMKVELLNDGPVTIIVDSKNRV